MIMLKMKMRMVTKMMIKIDGIQEPGLVFIGPKSHHCLVLSVSF